ncbi:hypothetical protein HBH56_039050 [Parastagonospora nodorum]|uniref:Uncharacterized protein n=2 Tax=Phaeosphaeria nodorum (strain SN15 / ATCC MYA-4574 / FGSC 10173) TaxID=321614 RepID=A0A7U2F6U6_PHANO|nr:hypothetical protein SNOG_06748 [Parastagonospora nodorum SN15]KAH3918626.1 hypothetical protein HBH56_039050 [Parastagonospora nodorum]EAT85399.2 hypothetical protein SNOG_06748 [Parastagonospora nodorum SN15]KAH3933972.1 hypothetical protein HBH54_060410 [Parastagonospora nodorum]KAH4142691.1 hypothetical protein HBH45_041380 [Parastagonospora nodorum]KAH4175215.1 hypothetical protein HBH44_007290 [Parastagonospora nodorum]
MDAHHDDTARLQAVLQALSRTPSETEYMPAPPPPPPPSYQSIASDPIMPLPTMHNPYDAEDEHDEDDTPEITINAATQVRGHGNIISIAQMDSLRIANLIATILRGDSPSPSPSSSPEATTLPLLASMTKPSRPYPRINVTVNCGATVIGDRNIVGPGLGDVARQMQVAHRNQVAQQAAKTAEMQSMAQRHGLFAAQTVTPPMSRSGSAHSDGAGVKRKADEEAEESMKRRC